MKMPALNITKTLSLDSRSGREFHESTVAIANDFAKACRRAGVEPEDVFPIFRAHAKIQYRNQSIF